MDDLIDRTQDAVVGAAELADRGVGTLAEGVAKSAHVASERVQDQAKVASRSAHHRLESAAEAIDRGYARVSGGVSRAATATGDFVIENPGKSILISAAAGFVLGLLVRQGAAHRER
jgi:ElaB/YqjD/DUF883 family membrane-anchored ribosome-binding protein